MKIAVLAICLNESKFVQRWAQSALGADHIILVDTGSTDDTVSVAKSLGSVDVHNISIKPWRFDLARNAALALVPSDVDVVVNLDLDEILVEGWRQTIEKTFADPTVTRLHYDYIWSWNPDGTPAVRFYRDMIHRRHGYVWKHPCHESLYPVGDEVVATTDDLKVEHHADNTKSRGHYLPLLEMAVTEDPNNDRMAHYFARELFFHSLFETAIPAFERHLSLPTAQWADERAQSMIYLSKSHHALGDTTQAEKWALAAYLTASWRREPLMQIATLAYEAKQWGKCLATVREALRITGSHKSYMNDPFAWGSFLYDIGYIAAYHLCEFSEAEFMITKALSFEPDNERLLNNFVELKKRQNEQDQH